MMVATNTWDTEFVAGMKYHRTVVAEFLKLQRLVVLRTDGRWTATTKKRMNQFAEIHNLGFRVYQENFDWFVWFPWQEERGRIEFDDSEISFHL